MESTVSLKVVCLRTCTSIRTVYNVRFEETFPPHIVTPIESGTGLRCSRFNVGDLERTEWSVGFRQIRLTRRRTTLGQSGGRGARILWRSQKPDGEKHDPPRSVFLPLLYICVWAVMLKRVTYYGSSV
jgi:hypothetical protein